MNKTSMEEGAGLSIHPFVDQSFGRLVELGETTYYGRDISKPEYLDWEYIQNPEGLALITIGESENKIVSQFIVIPRKFSVGGEILSGSLSVNTLTHPHFKGKGIFKKLADETFNRCKQDKILFTIGFPNPVSHPVIRRKQIFDITGYLPLLFIPLNPIRSLFRYIKNKRIKTGDEIDMNAVDSFISTSNNISLFDFKNDSDKYEKFLHNFNKEKQNVTFRSLQFLQWRYVNIPKRKYLIIKQERDNRINALLILRTKYLFGLRCTIIVDLITLIDSNEVKNLLNVAYEIAIRNKIDLLFTTVPSSSFEYKLLVNFGFYAMPNFFLPQKLAFIIKRHLPSCPERVIDFHQWFLTFGDYDIF